jgi:hypothetical protein
MHQIMKSMAILTIICAMAFSAWADPVDPFEIGSPHFSTNTDIIWQAPTNQLPQNFWTYRRILPQVFTEAVISNAIVLASLQSKGFPKPSTNDYWVPAFNPPPNCPGGIPIIFEIIPGDALLSYGLPNDADKRPDKDVPNDQAVMADALTHAQQLGLETSTLIKKSFYTDFNADYLTQNPTTNGIRGRGVFFSRQLDGLMFFSPDDQGDGAEGFFFELGSYGKILAFSVRWSNVERYQIQPVASPQEIIRCIRARKVIVLPDNDGDTYFAKIKQIATAKRFVISKITPYYTDSIFGEVMTDNTPCKFITPVAELDAIADFGNSNMTVHIYSPITSSDVNRLLGK